MHITFLLVLNLLAFNHLSIQSEKLILVSNAEELHSALKDAKDGFTIYVDDDSIIDLTGIQNIVIPRGVILKSGRGKTSKSKGALLYTTSNGTMPLFRLSNERSKIKGLRIQGPDTGKIAGIDAFVGRTAKDIKKNRLKYYKQNMYSVPNSRGIMVTKSKLEIEDCEIYGWTHAGILVNKTAKDVKISRNYIHHNQKSGLGYGIAINGGSAIITGNSFDFNRHSISGSGVPGTSFTVINNTFGPNHSSWAIDMHGGADRKDNTHIAGESFTIIYNTFRIAHVKGKVKGIVIRGVPTDLGRIENNTFVVKLKNNPRIDVKDVVTQLNKYGKLRVNNNTIQFN